MESLSDSPKIHKKSPSQDCSVDVVHHDKTYFVQAVDKLDNNTEIALKKLGPNTPCYCYFEEKLTESAKTLMSYKTPFGLTVRYAMKANSNKAILQLLEKQGLWIDSSSVNECYRAQAAGIPVHKISLTTQEVPSSEQLEDLILKKGIHYNASSLLQLENFGKLCPEREVGLRVNVGIGSGSFKRTTTGGKGVSFGVFEQQAEIDRILEEYKLKLTTIHLHIGSGADPELQKQAAKKVLEVAELYPTVTTLSLGGGYKVRRVQADKQTSIEVLSKATSEELLAFEKRTKRRIHLEIEPGTYAVALSGYIVAKIIDIVSTGKGGYKFLKIDSGMTEAMRIPLYGAQHPMYLIPMDSTPRTNKSYIVVGSCCETGDIMTPAPGMPEEIQARLLLEAKVGDLLIIGACGAYCSSMSPSNYNSHTIPAEYMVRKNGSIQMIRKKQNLEDLWRLEVDLC